MTPTQRRKRRMKRNQPYTARFSEAMSVADSRVDAESGVIHRVKILGRDSTNGRRYTDEAMDNASKLYEGAKVNLDHRKRSAPKDDRSITDRIGVLRNVFREGDGVYGDLHLFKKHPHADAILEMAETAPDTLGLSHDAEGRVRHEGDLVIVETVERVNSVDIVDDPATVQGLFESIETTPPDKEPDMKKRTIRQILKEATDKKDWRYVRLAEMATEEMVGDETVAEMEVDVPAEATAGDAVKAAFRAAVIAVLDDDSIDLEATKSKIAMLLDMQSEANGEMTEMDGDEEHNDASDEEASMGESHAAKPSKELTQLKEQVKQLTAERDDANLTAQCRDLLETHNREITDVRLNALKRADNAAERKALIESWAPVSQRPSRSPSILESDPGSQSYDAVRKEVLGAK